MIDERISYTPKEAAAVTRVALEQIRLAYRAGELVCHYRSPRRPVILREDLRRWIEAAPTREELPQIN